MRPNALAQKQVSVWSLRVQTLKAAFLIARAQWLIRRSPMKNWRGSLGTLIEQDALACPQSIPEFEMRAAAAVARRVTRAAQRFPLEPKCLPQAMALQWALAAEKTPSRLIIAMQNDAPVAMDEDGHAFHAWVELGGQFLIGACDRTQYRTVLAFGHISQGST
ncbi:MAG: lasso peptide biosynthesis B2 protein [Erythrobacter sp.]